MAKIGIDIDDEDETRLAVFDADKDPDVFQKYSVKSVPTFIVLNDENEIVSNKTGALSESQLTEWLGEYFE
jgi:thioredoxin-like negative regulator of GroEL